MNHDGGGVERLQHGAIRGQAANDSGLPEVRGIALSPARVFSRSTPLYCLILFRSSTRQREPGSPAAP